jgi:predicted ATPase
MIPRMEPVIGMQSALPDLGAEEAKNLLKGVFKRFVQVFADKEHPVLLFLDDLHWADPASLDLIEKLAEDGGIGFFCLIGTWRENEVPAHHALRKTMDAINKTGVHFQNLTVKPLDALGVNAILAGFLRCRADTCAPLAEILHEKTLGNPFFINQFLKILYEEKYLEMDISGEWRFDVNAIRNLQVTDNVVDFMAKKLRKLPPDIQEIIGICACIGNRFDTETLTDAAGKPISDILQIIDRLLLEGFIISKQGFYFFGHDRIYEAAYYLRSLESQKQTHYRIGKKCLKTRMQKNFTSIFFISPIKSTTENT